MPDFRDDKFKQMQDQSAYFKNKVHQSSKEGTAKKGISVGQKFGGFQYGGKGDDGTHRFHRADSAQVQESDKASFDSTMNAHNIIGQRELYSPDQKPAPRLMDSVFMQLNDPEIINRSQPRLAHNLVCTEKGGCKVEQPFVMGEKDIRKRGHTNMTMADGNKAMFTQYPQQGVNKMNTPTQAGATNAWNAGEPVSAELDAMAMRGDTTQAAKLVRSIPGMQDYSGNLFKTETVKDTIPGNAQIYTQEEMEGMRQTGAADGKRIYGYKNIDEAKTKIQAGQNPTQKQALSDFQQRIANSLKKKP